MARLEVISQENAVLAVVTLSRRNILALLAKLDEHPPASKRTIESTDCRVDGVYSDVLILVLRAEDDDEHYAQRPAPPGPMHPDTESFVRARGGWSRNEG